MTTETPTMMPAEATPDDGADGVADSTIAAEPAGPAGADDSTGTRAGGTALIPYVTRVLIFDSDPPTFVFTIDGVEITLSAGQLLNPVLFSTRVFERTRKRPDVPRGRGAVENWGRAVEELMATAKVVEMPADSQRAGALKAAVERAISNLQLGESVEDLRDRRALVVGTRRKIVLFAVDAILAQLAGHDQKPTREEIAQALIKLGCQHGRHNLQEDGKRIKVTAWSVKAPPSLAALGKSQRVAATKATVELDS